MQELQNKIEKGKIILASPRGFCAGVERAIEIVKRALEKLGPPVYVRHEVVHNRFVVDGLKAKGAEFVKSLDDVPDGANVVFSAHGVAMSVREKAKTKNLQVFDATCPLVTKVHRQVKRYAAKGMDVVLIGHAGHPEVQGTLGQYKSSGGNIYLIETVQDVEKLTPNNPLRLAYVSQTTLSVDDTQEIVNKLKMRFPAAKSPKKDDICYATQNRQNAVREIVDGVNLMLIVGSHNSSNSNRLRELAEKTGKPAYLIDGPAQIADKWLVEVANIGVSSGASAPEVLVREVIDYLERKGFSYKYDKPRTDENMKFPIPVELAVKT